MKNFVPTSLCRWDRVGSGDGLLYPKNLLPNLTAEQLASLLIQSRSFVDLLSICLDTVISTCSSRPYWGVFRWCSALGPPLAKGPLLPIKDKTKRQNYCIQEASCQIILHIFWNLNVKVVKLNWPFFMNKNVYFLITLDEFTNIKPRLESIKLV